MKSYTEQIIKLEKLYKVGSECDFNSWPDIGSNPTRANFL